VWWGLPLLFLEQLQLLSLLVVAFFCFSQPFCPYSSRSLSTHALLTMYFVRAIFLLLAGVLALSLAVEAKAPKHESSGSGITGERPLLSQSRTTAENALSLFKETLEAVLLCVAEFLINVGGDAVCAHGFARFFPSRTAVTRVPEPVLGKKNIYCSDRENVPLTREK
jgi:hypothetical protein